MALFAGAVEYTDCFSAHGLDSSNECPVVKSAGALEYSDRFSAHR